MVRDPHWGALATLRKRSQDQDAGERRFRSVDSALVFFFAWGPKLQACKSTGITSQEDLEMRLIDCGPSPMAEDARLIVADIKRCIDVGGSDGPLTDEEKTVLAATFGLQIGQRRESRGGVPVYIDEREELVMDRRGARDAQGKTRACDSSTPGRQRRTRAGSPSGARLRRGELSYGEVARRLGWMTTSGGEPVANHTKVGRTLARARGKLRTAMRECGLLEA